jgi:hypothetical protein
MLFSLLKIGGILSMVSVKILGDLDKELYFFIMMQIIFSNVFLIIDLFSIVS